MYNICCRMMNNSQEAEDMLQEAFTECFLRLDTFRYESSFGAWLKRIVINKCINELKRKKADLVFSDEMHKWDSTQEDEFKNLDETRLSVHKIQQAIEKLPDGYRVVFSLYMLEGYDHAEISDILGVSESTSKSQYMRAKNRIKQIILQMN